MLVAVMQMTMLIPGSDSLKSKRFVLQSIKTRLRNKFNVSVAEVADNDKWQRMTLGLAIVANERKFLDQVINQIINLIDAEDQVEMIDHQIEIF
jgi:uncharacterized protein